MECKTYLLWLLGEQSGGPSRPGHQWFVAVSLEVPTCALKLILDVIVFMWSPPCAFSPPVLLLRSASDFPAGLCLYPAELTCCFGSC